jgi:hypothetical protein
MIGNPIEIFLLPQQVVLRQPRRWFRGAKIERSIIRDDLAQDDTHQWAVGACSRLLKDEKLRRRNLVFIFSDLWMRYDLIQLGDNGLTDKDALALANVQFLRQYPATETTVWPLRLARQNHRMLVAGMNPSLFSALSEMSTQTDNRLLGAEPLFARIFDQHSAARGATDGWLLFEQPGLLMVAFIEQGQLVSLHSQRCAEAERAKTAQLLLDRQSALINRPVGAVRIGSFSGKPLTLSEPWHCSQFLLVGPFGTVSQV